MKLIDVNTFDYENRKGEKIWCVEEVTNDDEMTGLETYECENEEEARVKCEELNKSCQDKRFKYIVVRYLIEEDGLTAD